MISYKVLIALTVTNIICCGCDEGEKMKLYECCNILYDVGFPRFSGFVDYCFVKQFLLNEVLNENTQLNIMDAESQYQSLDHDKKDTIINASFEKFKEFAKKQYSVQELDEIVKEFFKYNANITADSRLKTPKEFCSDYRNQQSGFWSNILMLCAKSPKTLFQECITAILKTKDDQKLKTEDAEILKTENEKNNVTEIENAEILTTEDAEILKTENEKVPLLSKCKSDQKLKTEDECIAEILTTDDECIAEILTTEDDQKLKTEDEKNNMTEIEKGQILRIDDGTYYKETRDYIINKLPDFKKKYYEYQIKVIEEITRVFQDHRTWCANTKGFKNPWEQ